jgi:hypothetical protein
MYHNFEVDSSTTSPARKNGTLSNNKIDNYSMRLESFLSAGGADPINTQPDIEPYLQQLAKEIGEETLKSHMFLDGVVDFLDNLYLSTNNPSGKFNRVLFMHIIEFGSFPKEAPILLADFFKYYFIVYESMKSNLHQTGIDCSSFSNEIEKLKIKLQKAKPLEKELENGITSNSKLMFDIKEIIYKGDKNIQSDNNILGVRFKLEVSIDDQKMEVDLNDSSNIKKINKLPVNRSNGSKINVNLNQYNNNGLIMTKSTPLDQFDLLSVFEAPIGKEYSIPNFGKVFINFIWINSKINFINKNISELEKKLLEYQLNFNFLEKSTMFLEEPFEKMMKSIFDSTHNIEYSNGYGGKNEISPNNGLEIQKIVEKNQFEVSEKIENFIGRIVGNSIIIWENILFFINRILLLLLIFNFYYRADYATVRIIK